MDYLEFISYIKKFGYNYEVKNGEITLFGKSVHSKDSKNGINAIVELVNILLVRYPIDYFKFLSEEIGFDTTSKKIFGDVSDDISGELSVNIAKLLINSEKTEICLDLRLPVLCNKDRLVKDLIACAGKYQLSYEEFDYLPSLYVPKDSC